MKKNGKTKNSGKGYIIMITPEGEIKTVRVEDIREYLKEAFGGEEPLIERDLTTDMPDLVLMHLPGEAAYNGLATSVAMDVREIRGNAVLLKEPDSFDNFKSFDRGEMLAVTEELYMY